jgi:hypothetical protein
MVLWSSKESHQQYDKRYTRTTTRDIRSALLLTCFKVRRAMLLVFTLAMDFTTPQSFEGSICSHAITLKLCGASDSSGSAAKVVFRNSRAAGGPKVRPLTPVLFFFGRIMFVRMINATSGSKCSFEVAPRRDGP